jgi:hypothetical protein
MRTPFIGRRCELFNAHTVYISSQAAGHHRDRTANLAVPVLILPRT